MAIPAFLKKVSMVGAGAAVMAIGTMASAQAATLGGQLFSNGGNIKVQVLLADAGFTSELRLFNAARTSFTSIANNRQVGRVVDLGSFTKGQELIFGIFVTNTGNTFFTGPASRNPDGIFHNVTNQVAPGDVYVGFEDLFGGGDRDYNDNIFRFTGAIQDSPVPVNVPEPASIVGLLAVGALASRLKGAPKKA